MNKHDLMGLQEPLGDTQRPNDVIGDDSAGISDDVGLAVSETQKLGYIHPGIHAGDDGQFAARLGLKVGVGEGGSELAVG